MAIVLGDIQLSTDDLVRIAHFNEPVELHSDALERIRKCRKMLEEKIQSREIMYGVNTGIGELKELIYRKLRIINVYLKEFNKKADMEEPLIMWQGCTLKDLCLKLHKDFVDKFKFAKVWGHSSKFPGQKIVKLDHVLQDKDIVELRMN